MTATGPVSPPPRAAPRPPRPTPPRIEHLLGLYRATVNPPRRRLFFALFFVAVFGAAHLARAGTTPFHAAAVGCLVLWLLLAVVTAVRRVRASRGTEGPLRTVLRRADATSADRALRALRLSDRAAVDPTVGSAELAGFHLRRSIASLSADAVRTLAERAGRRLQTAALVAAVAVMGLVLVGPFRVVEGLDLLLARTGTAPLPLSYLDDVILEIHPPEYVHEKDATRFGLVPVDVPHGTLLTVRGVPLHPARKLALYDGTVETPFVEDGKGGLAARWPVGDSVELHVVARFGQMRIEQADLLLVRSIADEVPRIEVEGAPRTVRLLEQTEIPIAYRATDDHGLRDVDLVMRAGTTEDRRTLARLDGETRSDTGGYLLHAVDRFVRASFLPISVTVEARDNDPLTGPKWGRSAVITLVPPAVGEPEALRYDAFVHVRDELVDLLAQRMKTPPPKLAGERKAYLTDERERLYKVLAGATVATGQRWAGLDAGRLAVVVAGLQRKLREDMEALAKDPSAAGHARSVTRTEDAVLALDGGLRRQATKDARRTARRLAEVASGAADGFQAMMGEEAEHGRERSDAALLILEPGGKALARLGELGWDLGTIVANDLRRIRRAMAQNDVFHAELAARDLALRLSHPKPSFQGGGGSGKGTESGGGAQDPGEEGDEGEDPLDEADSGIKQIAHEHASNMGEVDQAANDARQGAEMDALRDAAKQHAEAIRDAARRLPQARGEPDTPEAAAASAHDQARQMADALERLAPSDAVDMGHAAERSLDEAIRGAARAQEWDGDRTGKLAREAQEKLSPEVQWAEEALEKMRKLVNDRARTGPARNREKQLADRTRQLAEQGQAGALPGSALEHLRSAENKMRDAERELGKGDVDKALDAQRQAQRSLDRARADVEQGREGEGKDEAAGNGRETGARDTGSGHTEIPGAGAHKQPEAFRKRVLDGLADGDLRLRPAIKRYAEKILR